MTEADRLYRAHAASLVRYLTRQLGDRDLAEDVAQETFLRALRHEPRLNPRSWLFTTATNLLRDVARRDTRQRQHLERLHAEQLYGAAEAFDDEQAPDDSPIQLALKSLGERDRTALLLSEEGLSYNEIAVMLGMSMQSVGTTLTRARKRMIRHYEQLIGTVARKGGCEMNIVLPPLVRTLEPFVVTTAQPNWTSPAHQSCLTSFEPYSSADSRMFQALRGAIRPTGDFRMEVVDWPMQGNTVSAVFTMESAGTLVGRVRAMTAELRITLTRDGEVWRGSASETRNYKPRWRRVAMRESGCAN